MTGGFGGNDAGQRNGNAQVNINGGLRVFQNALYKIQNHLLVRAAVTAGRDIDVETFDFAVEGDDLNKIFFAVTLDAFMLCKLYNTNTCAVFTWRISN